MDKVFIKSIFQLLIVFPLILIFLKKGKINYKLIFLFFGFFMMNSLMLELPRKIEWLNFINGNWNWSGKIYAIISSLIFYFTFRRVFIASDFLTIKQERKSLAINIIIIVVILSFVVILNGLFNGGTEFSIETLGFQLTMPGFDEELSFRVIMIGILLSLLKDNILIKNINLGNPSMWITAILFGLVHGFKINENWGITMDWSHFSFTFIFGLIWAWMAIKSKSFFMPMVSHNMTNFIGALVNMLK